jgi:hypothetical protein
VAKYAVCVGINDYPGTCNDLRGCINDANDWAELLRNDFDFSDNVTILTDAEATKKNIIAALKELVAGAKGGDVIVFTYSGHGTWVYDQGDRDESDNRDEAICTYDEIIIDDEIRGIISEIDREAHLTIISDSCHSGSVTRAQIRRTYKADSAVAENAPKPRYMPPLEEIDAIRTSLIPIRRRFLYPELNMTEVLLSGCNATEYSYDTYINDKFSGVMTAMAIRLIKGNPEQTYLELHKKLRLILPSTSYPQSPQLEGSEPSKNLKLFN